jgi:RimJ/RimL family protein N-acetyltransferase
MLIGEKVILRAARRDDLPRIAEFDNDPAFAALVDEDPWEPVALERLEARFTERLGEGERDGPRFAIEADGQYIGHCLLYRIDDFARVCQLGIGIGDPAYQGRGYGREAITLLLRYAFDLRNLRRVGLSVNADNERALRAYRACGFVEEGRLREQAWVEGRYIDVVVMGILRAEWRSRQAAK